MPELALDHYQPNAFARGIATACAWRSPGSLISRICAWLRRWFVVDWSGGGSV
jgi:hypothetical protein